MRWGLRLKLWHYMLLRVTYREWFILTYSMTVECMGSFFPFAFFLWDGWKFCHKAYHCLGGEQEWLGGEGLAISLRSGKPIHQIEAGVSVRNTMDG